MSDRIYAIKIEALGNVFGQYRFASGRPLLETGLTSAGLWRVCFTGMPQEIATTIDFKDATTTVGGMGFELNLNRLPDIAPALLTRRAPVLAYNASALGIATTSITLINRDGTPATGLSSLLGVDIILERECIRLTTETAPGVYDCVRGRLGTLAVPHNVTVEDDVEVFSSERPSFIKTRVIEFCEYDASGDITSEKVLWRGVISKSPSKGGASIYISANSILALIDRKRLLTRVWRARPLEGSNARKGSVIVRGGKPPIQGSGSLRRVLINIGGETAAYVTMATTGDQVRFEWGEDTGAEIFPGAPRFDEVSEDTKDLLIWESFSTRDGAPEINGVSLSDNPFTLILQLLTTSLSGSNGAYDLGDPARPEIADTLGMSINVDLIDVAAIESLRDQIGTSAKLDAVHIAVKSPDPIAFKTLAQRILRPFGCVLTVGRDFKFTVARLLDAPEIAAKEITSDDIVLDSGPTVMDIPPDWSFDQIVGKFDHTFGQPPRSLPFDDGFRRRRLVFGSADSVDLEIPSSDITLVDSIAAYYISRFHYDIALVTIVVPAVPAFEVYNGDVVTFSEPWVIDDQGGLGVEAASALIVGRRYNISTFSYTYEALLFATKTGKIGPSAMIFDSTPDPDFVIYDNMYSATPGPYDSDLGGFAEDDVVDILDSSDLTVIGSDVIVGIVDGGPGFRSIELQTGGWSDSDIIVAAEYGLATASQKDRIAYIADSNASLSGDEPDEWTT